MKSEKAVNIWILALVFLGGIALGYSLGYTNAITFCGEVAVKVLKLETNLSDYGISLIREGIAKGIIG